MRRATPLWIALLVVGWLGTWWRAMQSTRWLALALAGSYLLPWCIGYLVAPARRRDLVTRFALSIAGIVTIWLALETVGALGLVSYQALLRAPISEWWYGPPYNVVDPDLLYMHRPHLALSGSQPGDIAAGLCLDSSTYTYDVRYDRNGFRNETDLSTADVAVIGDSFIEAPTMATDKLMTSVLARLTGQTIANLGMSAYGPQQELVVMRRYALPLRPRTIVWAFYEGNDIKDLRRYEARRTELLQPRSRFHREASLARNGLLALTRLLRGCAGQPSSSVVSTTFPTLDGSTVRMYLPVGGRPVHETMPRAQSMSSVTETDLALLADIFSEAHGLARRNDIRLMVLFVPTAFRVYHDLVKCERAADCAHWTSDDLPRRIEAMLLRVSPDIEYVDLTPEFRAAARRGEVLYRPDDTHWTHAGHRTAAEITAGRLRSRTTAARPLAGNRRFVPRWQRA